MGSQVFLSFSKLLVKILYSTTSYNEPMILLRILQFISTFDFFDKNLNIMNDTSNTWILPFYLLFFLEISHEAIKQVFYQLNCFNKDKKSVSLFIQLKRESPPLNWKHWWWKYSPRVTLGSNETDKNIISYSRTSLNLCLIDLILL